MDTLMILGAIAMIGAVVGGGLKALGVDIPVISTPRAVMLFVLGLVFFVVGYGIVDPDPPESGDDEGTEVAGDRADDDGDDPFESPPEDPEDKDPPAESPIIMPTGFDGFAVVDELELHGIPLTVSCRASSDFEAGTTLFVDPAQGAEVDPTVGATIRISTGPPSARYSEITARGSVSLGVTSGQLALGPDGTADLDGEATSDGVRLAVALIEKTFGEDMAVNVVSLTAADQFTALQTGEVDIGVATRTGQLADQVLLPFSDDGVTKGIVIPAALEAEVRCNYERALIERLQAVE